MNTPGRPMPRGGALPRRFRALAAIALVVYGCVLVSLTMLKAFFQIGMLWRPESQRARSVQLEPFAAFRDAASWFGPVFDALGNVALFLPAGVLLYILVDRWRRPLIVVTVAGAVLSAAVEILQYVFELGRSDVNDLMFNTVGALLGAVLARFAGRRLYPLWVGLTLVAGAVFAALVALGPTLGDPAKVVDLASG